MTTLVDGEFEWDTEKAEANLAKHGVSFAEAATVFEDPHGVLLDDPKRDGRYWLIGFSRRANLLLVVHAETGIRTRLISARKVKRHEAKRYQAPR
jgi:hypothetical protein